MLMLSGFMQAGQGIWGIASALFVMHIELLLYRTCPASPTMVWLAYMDVRVSHTRSIFRRDPPLCPLS